MIRTYKDTRVSDTVGDLGHARPAIDESVMTLTFYEALG